MTKSKLSLLILAVLMSFNSFAQCPWTISPGIQNLSCYGNCDGKVVIVTNAPTGYSFTFLWSTGETTHYIDKVCEGTYIVTVSDDKGCTSSYSFDLTAPKALEVSCTATVPTAPGTLTANAVGGTPPYSYTWNTVPPQYTQTITGVPAGSYTVYVEDANKCAGSSTCKIDDVTIVCGGRTQTMGGWGAPPNGNNPGTYVHANFASAFPNGLTIGCTNTLKLTSAQKITDFLPSGSTAKALPAGNMVDNVAYKNVLAGQLVAATLSIGFDIANPNFSPASITLDNQIINNGDFAGKTVGFLVTEANNKIGGCASVYSFSQLNDALTMVNENYVGGTINNGNLECEPKARTTNKVVEANSLSYKVYPNPFSSVAHLEFTSVSDSHVQVDLLELSGRVVKSLFEGDVNSDANTKVEVSSEELNNGMYLVRIKSGNDTYNQRIFIQK